MAAHIVLPPLKTWAQQHLTAVLKATTQSAFNTAFDAFIAKDASITVNGKHVTRDAYKRTLEGFEDRSVDVKFNEMVEVPTSPNTIEAGVVGLFYSEHINQKPLVHDVPMQVQVTSSLNLSIEEDKSISPPHLPHGIHGDFDGRRVMSVNQISLELRVFPNAK